MASAIATPQPRVDRPEPGWREIAAAMSKTGAGAVASGLLSAGATKIIAVVLGPASVALVSTLQQVTQTALCAATFNGQTALVQGASALKGLEQRDYLRTTLRLFALATLTIAMVMLCVPASIARLAGLPPQFANLVGWLAIPLMCLSAFTFLSSVLRATGEIGKLALIQVFAAVAMALAAWPAALAARSGHPSALVGMLGLSAAAATGGAVWAIARHGSMVRAWFSQVQENTRYCRVGTVRVGNAAWHFFSISGAMLASSLTASAVLLAVRGHITRISGIGSTGQFDAAWGISMGHVTLILSAMQVYYLPVLAKARDAEARRRQIASVLTVAIVAVTPLIVSLLLLRPIAISVLYSPAFHPAVQYLRWTLIGDYLKVTSWVLAIPMLAAADMRAFLTADFSTQAAFLGGAWVLARVRGPAEAAAIAFAISYAVNFAICYFYARRRYGFRFGPRIAVLWMGGLALVSAVSLGGGGV
jgi:O-antigen/teichoic acid export membrane protein